MNLVDFRVVIRRFQQLLKLALAPVLIAHTTGESLASTIVIHSAMFEQRFFHLNPALIEQLDSTQASVVLSSDVSYRSEDRKTRIKFVPYLRLDERDGKRSYFDIREANVSYQSGDWDMLVGVGQVFWGVNESRNPVDVINQIDQVENIDEEEKLGQPMIRLSYRGDWGTLEGYYLPIFRERRFPGEIGRLRLPIALDEQSVQYERDGKENAGDYALRYTRRTGSFDLGLHSFYGTSRAPLLISNSDNSFTPFYQRLRQVGLDLQYTSGSWLLKAEIVRAHVASYFWTAVGGFEYTFFDLRSTGLDLGVIVEYLHDDREELINPQYIFENDVFFGTRLTFNNSQDTEVLAGVIVDTSSKANQLSVKFQSRVKDNFLLEFELAAFDSSKPDPVQALKRDDVFIVKLTGYF